jgi:hypothetical protein
VKVEVRIYVKVGVEVKVELEVYVKVGVKRRWR